MKKYCFLVFLISVIPSLLTGQHAYFSKSDSSIIFGFELIDGGHLSNSKFCLVKKGREINKYTADEVKEYGFKNGRIFKSFTLNLNNQTSRYFLERLVTGKIDLYYLKEMKGAERYYLAENESNELIEIPEIKDEYSLLFLTLVSNCPQAVDNIHFVKIRKDKLMRYFNSYNNCDSRAFPRFRYGFTIGISTTILSPVDKESVYSIPDYSRLWSITFGASVDIPVRTSNISFHPGIFYKQIGIAKAFKFENADKDLVINCSTITFPLLFRYSILKDKISPFFQAGPVYSMQIRNKSTLYGYETDNNDIFINVINDPVLHRYMGGFAVGSGIVSGKSWFGEISFSRIYNLGNKNNFLNFSEITLGIGRLF